MEKLLRKAISLLEEQILKKKSNEGKNWEWAVENEGRTLNEDLLSSQIDTKNH